VADRLFKSFTRWIVVSEVIDVHLSGSRHFCPEQFRNRTCGARLLNKFFVAEFKLCEEQPSESRAIHWTFLGMGLQPHAKPNQ